MFLETVILIGRFWVSMVTSCIQTAPDAEVHAGNASALADRVDARLEEIYTGGRLKERNLEWVLSWFPQVLPVWGSL